MRWPGNCYLGWSAFWGRAHGVFVFLIPLKGIFWAILWRILDLMNLSKLINLLLDLDFGLGIYCSCYKADGTRQKSTDCYWKWCSKHFHQQVLKIHGHIVKIWWNWKTMHTWTPRPRCGRNLLFPITGHFGFVFEENPGMEITCLS